MIIFSSKDFGSYKYLFELSAVTENSLTYYLGQYEELLSMLNKIAMATEYRLNVLSYPYLFLLRHCCELKLKKLIADRGLAFPQEHSFQPLIDILQDVPESLTDALKVIDLDVDGSCYRYLYDKKANSNILAASKREFLPFYQTQENIPLANPYNFLFGMTPPFNKHLRWELTFHFNEITTRGQFRSTYDWMTSLLLQQIIAGALDINKVYLPLLFYIRHSLELALKESLFDLLHDQDAASKKKIARYINSEHSLTKLFNILSDILPKDVSQLPGNYPEQFELYLAQSTGLQHTVHILDANSRNFRYPDAHSPLQHHLRSNTLIQIITDFLEADVFLTFNVDVLKEYGLIPYSNADIEQMMGI